MSVQFKLRKKIKKTLISLSALSGKIENKVVFESYRGRQYSDNPRAVSEKLHELYPGFKIVWGLADPNTEGLPDYIRAVRVGTPEYLKELATAFAFVRNDVMTDDLSKRKGQVFIQTWHGDRGIKNILYDKDPEEAKHMHLMDEFYTDLFVTGSDYAGKRIVTAFRYHGEVMKTGCPRNDCLVHPGNVSEIKKKIGVGEDKKLLLFALTLKKYKKGEILRSAVDLSEVLKRFNARGGDWVCLARAHPKSMGIEVPEGSSVIDVSKYPDMADLLMVSDALITDYSSCAGDFILRKKPVLLAQFDVEEYKKNERDFYFDIREAGFLIAHDQDELNAMIDGMTDEQFEENCEKLMRYFGTCETGHSSEDVCRWIYRRYKKYRVGKQKGER